MVPRRNNEPDIYTTLDSYQASWLYLKGFHPQLRSSASNADKIIYVFAANESLYQAIDEYNSGGKIEALRFAITIKNLKSQIFSMRRSNEDASAFTPPK